MTDIQPKAAKRSPPTGSTGGKLANSLTGMQVSVDYLRLVMPLASWEEFIKRVGNGWWGEMKARKPMWSFDSAQQNEWGVLVMRDSAKKARQMICVDIPGCACDRINVGRMIRGCVEAGGWTTRVDVALDFFFDGSGPDLMQVVRESVTRGELVGFKTVRRIEEERSNRVIGRTMYFGKRGSDGSGRFVRLYDKGLEQSGGEDEAGRFIRLEVEFGQAVAKKVGALLAETVIDAETLVGLVASSICFRERVDGEDDEDDEDGGGLLKDGRVDPKRPDGHLDRRPIVDWWQKLIGRAERPRITAERSRPRWDSFAMWIHQQVGPTLKGVAAAVGCSPAELVQHLTEGCACSVKPCVAAQAVEALDGVFRRIDAPGEFLPPR